MSAANRNNMTSAAHNNGFLVDALENELAVGEWRELGDMVALFEENHFNYQREPRSITAVEKENTKRRSARQCVATSG